MHSRRVRQLFAIRDIGAAVHKTPLKKAHCSASLLKLTSSVWLPVVILPPKWQDVKVCTLLFSKITGAHGTGLQWIKGKHFVSHIYIHAQGYTFKKVRNFTSPNIALQDSLVYSDISCLLRLWLKGGENRLSCPPQVSPGNANISYKKGCIFRSFFQTHMK